MNSIDLTALLWLIASDDAQSVAEFETYEKEAYRILRKHSGALLHVVRLNQDEHTPFEIHFIRFAARNAYEAFLVDPERSRLSATREKVIARTLIFEGRQGPSY